jgi:rubrerythrin
MKSQESKRKLQEPKSDKKQIEDLLYQALETELGGVEVYRQAILCARNVDLKKEWKEYLEQTERHVEIVRGVFEALAMDAEAVTPGRLIVRDKGKALLAAMAKALKDAPQAAQVVAAECVIDAETKDHRNWELIGVVSKNLEGAPAKALADAYEKVEDEEDEHLYHTMGWCRELWLDSLGLAAQMPPLEEERDVKTGVEAAKIDVNRRAAVKRGSNGKGRQPQPRA